METEKSTPKLSTRLANFLAEDWRKTKKEYHFKSLALGSGAGAASFAAMALGHPIISLCLLAGQGLAGGYLNLEKLGAQKNKQYFTLSDKNQDLFRAYDAEEKKFGRMEKSVALTFAVSALATIALLLPQPKDYAANISKHGEYTGALSGAFVEKILQNETGSQRQQLAEFSIKFTEGANSSRIELDFINGRIKASTTNPAFFYINEENGLSWSSEETANEIARHYMNFEKTTGLEVEINEKMRF